MGGKTKEFTLSTNNDSADRWRNTTNCMSFSPRKKTTTMSFSPDVKQKNIGDQQRKSECLTTGQIEKLIDQAHSLMLSELHQSSQHILLKDIRGEDNTMHSLSPVSKLMGNTGGSRTSLLTKKNPTTARSSYSKQKDVSVKSNNLILNDAYPPEQSKLKILNNFMKEI